MNLHSNPIPLDGRPTNGTAARIHRTGTRSMMAIIGGGPVGCLIAPPPLRAATPTAGWDDRARSIRSPTSHTCYPEPTTLAPYVGQPPGPESRHQRSSPCDSGGPPKPDRTGRLDKDGAKGDRRRWRLGTVAVQSVACRLDASQAGSTTTRRRTETPAALASTSPCSPAADPRSRPSAPLARR